jgi:YD repeat-containing protein
MKIAYDPEVDALSIIFRDVTVTTKELGEGIALDYDQEGRLAGIEVLDAVLRFGGQETLRQVVLEGLGLAQPALKSPGG